MSATYDGVEYEEGGFKREQGYSVVSRGEAVYVASFAYQGHQGNRFRSYVWAKHVFRDGHMESTHPGWVPVEVLGPQFFDMDTTSSDEVEEALEAMEALEASKDLQAGEAHDALAVDTLAADEQHKWEGFWDMD